MADKGLHIREMTLDDVPRVAELEQDIFPAPWSEEGIANLLEKRRHAGAVIGEVQKSIVAYAFYWVVAGEMHIANIAVDRNFRRRKIGEGLLTRILADAAGEGAVYAFLEVRASNSPAIRLYEKFGFHQIGVRKGYYPDNKEDALVMAKSFKE